MLQETHNSTSLASPQVWCDAIHTRARARGVAAAAMYTRSQGTLEDLEASNELSQLLERVATELPPLALIIILRPLPFVELARLACVHKAFRVVLLILRQNPGQASGRPRYGPPDGRDFARAQDQCRLARAACFGDVAVLQAMITAGVDEHGTPLLEAIAINNKRSVDHALYLAACSGFIQAVDLLLDAGVGLLGCQWSILEAASSAGHADIVAFLIQRGADNDSAMAHASASGNDNVVKLLIGLGADIHARNDGALRNASRFGHIAVVAVLLERGANVHAVGKVGCPTFAGRTAIQLAFNAGHAEIVQLLLLHGAQLPFA